MSHIALKCLCLALSASVLSAPALCQQGSVSLAGEVIQEGGPLDTSLAAELYDPNRGVVVGQSHVRLDGTFEFSGLPAGQFLLRVTGPYGDCLQQALVSLRSGQSNVEVRLPARPRQTPPTGSVSLARLQHKVPAKALRELRREQEAFLEGDLPGSIAHLKQALKIDPECVEAHANLGARYMTAGEYDQAAAEFGKAVDLDPSPEALVDWAGALYLLRRYDDAEAAARRAVTQAPGQRKAQYVLGLTLLAERKSEQECLRALDSAAAEYPKAREFAAELRQRLEAGSH